MLRPFAGCTVKLDTHEFLAAQRIAPGEHKAIRVYNNRQAVLFCKNYTPLTSPQLADMHPLWHSCDVAMCMLTGDC